MSDADRFGDVGGGLSSFASISDRQAPNAATVYGVSKAAFVKVSNGADAASRWKVIIEHQAVGAYLMICFASLDVARTYAWRAAWAADHPEHFAPHLNVIPKVFAAEQTLQAVAKCMELFGGASIMRDVGVEKLLRDAAVFLHSDGTNMILRERLASAFRTMDNRSLETILNPG